MSYVSELGLIMRKALESREGYENVSINGNVSGDGMTAIAII